jgi:uncharacterized protein YjbJ (UPF0337 family)
MKWNICTSIALTFSAAIALLQQPVIRAQCCPISQRGTPMNEDRVVGTTRNLGGKAQEGIGRITGDTRSQVEGVINEAAGAAQDLYGQAKETAANASEVVRQSAIEAEDYVRRTIEHRPYTTALAAFVFGWFIGRMGRRD